MNIRRVLFLGFMIALAGCTSPELRYACALDREGQPVIVPVESVGAALEPLLAIPIDLVHAGVQAGCAAVLR